MRKSSAQIAEAVSVRAPGRPVDAVANPRGAAVGPRPRRATLRKAAEVTQAVVLAAFAVSYLRGQATVALATLTAVLVLEWVRRRPPIRRTIATAARSVGLGRRLTDGGSDQPTTPGEPAASGEPTASDEPAAAADRGRRPTVRWRALLGTAEAALLITVWSAHPGGWPIVSVLTALAAFPLLGAVLRRQSPRRITRTALRALALDRRPDRRIVLDAIGHITVVGVAAVLAALAWAMLTGHPLVHQRTIAPGEVRWSVGALGFNLLYGVLAAGVGEELFRLGLARRLDALAGRAATGLASRWALTVATVIWTAGHGQYPLAYLVFVFLMGMVFVRAYERSGSLWTAIATHATVNVGVSIGAFLFG